ncbi:MAG: MarR family winged helix-turn-helix transcriptional regulator [Solobacterium sp.]|nr:MarR family winged helix-turn-helix transcriptional regulator [Solobacterium sp.]
MKQTDRDRMITDYLHKCGYYIYHNSPGGQSQTQILLYLLKEGKVSQKELQEHMKIQSGSVSEVITKLENKGFIQRERDDADRRRVTVSLTKAGKNCAEHRKNSGSHEICYPLLTEEQKDQLIQLLELTAEGWRQTE